VPVYHASRARTGRAELRLAVDALSQPTTPPSSRSSCARPTSLLLLPAPSSTRLSLLLSLSVLHKHLRCCTHGMLQAPVSGAHTNA
jgi:hypothetical protein